MQPAGPSRRQFATEFFPRRENLLSVDPEELPAPTAAVSPRDLEARLVQLIIKIRRDCGLPTK